MSKYILLLLSLVFTSCAGVATVATVYTVSDIASVATTEKTVDDHIASAVTKKDCSVERFIDGKKYCLEKKVEEKPVEQPKKYCYKTLATVDCYLEPLKNRNDYLLNP